MPAKRQIFCPILTFDGGEVILQAIKPDVTKITSCRIVISIEHTACRGCFFLLILPFRERKNFIRSS